MARATVLALAACCLLAGCGLGGPTATPMPSPEPPDVAVTLSNNASASYRAEVFLVPGFVESIDEQTTTGETRTVSNFSAGARLFKPDDVATVVRPSGSRPQGTYDLAPGSRVATTVADPPRPATVLIVATHDDRVIAWGLADCGEDDLTRVDFEVHDSGPGIGIGCGSIPEPDER